MVNAVIYARFSSSKQREESIEGQIRICSEYAKLNGLKIVGEYCDRAVSGRSDTRPEFQRMIKDSAKGIFDVVIVWNFDRFAREHVDSAVYRARLKNLGIKVISVTQAVPEGPHSVLFEAIYDAFAEMYSLELSQKVIRGMTENALKGLFNGSYRPYGYDIKDNNFVINSDEARVVEKIFKMYSEGEKIKTIKDFCNSRGYKTPKGREFGYSFIGRMLKNEKYIGILIWNGIEFEKGIPPIVDKGIYKKVQKRLEENSNAGARGKAIEEYALVGKVFCGLCEEPLVADSAKKKVKTVVRKNKSTFSIPTFNRIGDSIFNSSYIEEEITEYKRYRYYKCRGQKQEAYKNGCKKKTVDKDTLENAVISYTASQYLADENLDELAKAIYKEQRRIQDDSNLKDIEYKILEETKKIENLYTMVESGHFTNNIFERIEKLELRVSDYEKEKSQLVSARSKLELKDIRERLNLIKQKMQKYIKDGEIPIEVKKAFCDAFIDRVYVFDDDGGDGNKKKKKMKITIVFDAFESEGLFGFDEAEIELSSISTTFGSPQSTCRNTSAFFFVFLFVISENRTQSSIFWRFAIT